MVLDKGIVMKGEGKMVVVSVAEYMYNGTELS